ncbi:DUF5672 family protein [uncultured Psychroserpens sp.]|uniref:DUF5672 family protein n=1 Tax=uncultured Psychroserpens sp. TaxID=255436 RepID=UPI002602232C|nr:DUF5672 family protein [uncultured Psychroserpens sp.]
MINLDNVTLLGIDCVNIDRLIYASQISQKEINFKSVKLLSHLDSKHESVVKIPKIDSIEAYSQFVIEELHKYIETEFVLIIQFDGYVLNPQAWTSDFLNYDYIGAPCNWGIGNGGFSLRSKKLLKLLANDQHIKEHHPEDIQICVTYKSYLESKGIKFATLDIARQFSVENGIWNQQFGFHNADISNWDINRFADPQLHSSYIERFNKNYVANAIKLTYIVHFYIEDSKVDPISELIQIYSSYDVDLLKKIHFVFVDDHSKAEIRIPEDINLNYTLVRVRDDITWNQAGARNLGVKYAKSERIILTDLDLTFPEVLFEKLVDFHPPNNSIFKFNTFSGMVRTEPHFNVFFLTRDVFMRTKGVDEEFSGRYGYEDVFFYFLNKALGVKFYLFRHHNIVHREHRENTETQHNPLTRNMDYNEALFERKMDIIKASDNPLDARSDVYLNFEWDVIQEHSMA